MASFNKFESFVTELAAGTFVSALNADTDVLKVFLTNTQPVAATHTQYGSGGGAELDDLADGNGYTKGGDDAANAASTSSGTITVVGTDITWTASGGTIGAFQFAVLYDDTATNDDLIGWWDYGSAVTLQIGESFTADFGASLFTIA